MPAFYEKEIMERLKNDIINGELSSFNCFFFKNSMVSPNNVNVITQKINALI